MVSRYVRTRFLKLATATLAILGLVGFGTSASAATAGSWSSAATVSTSTNQLSNAQVLSDAQGNLTAIWQELQGSIYVLRTSMKAFGGSWSQAQTISPAGKSIDSATLLIDSEGNLTAAWRTTESPRYSLQSATKLGSGTWSAPENITPAGEDVAEVSIAADSLGNVTAIWRFFNGSGWILRSATKPFGGSWSSSVDLSPVGSITDPELVVDAQGNVTVVWDQNSGSNEIYATSRTQAGVWSQSQRLSSSGVNSYGSVLAIDGQGTVIAFWTANNGSSDSVFSSNKPSGGNWTTVATESGLGSNFGLSQLAADSVGNLFVLGGNNSGLSRVVVASTKPVGGQWTTKTSLSDSSQDGEGEQLVVDGSGNVTAIWSWGSFQSQQVFIQSANCPFGGSWSTAVNLSSSNTYNMIPALSIADTGVLFASWSMRGNPTNSVQFATMAWDYALTYAPNGGSGVAPVTQTVAGYSSATLASGSTLYREGYSFSGWNTRADGSGTAFAAGSTLQINSDTTVYAQWTRELAKTGDDRNMLPVSAVSALVMLVSGLLLLARRKAAN